jgi:hypothetical protein
LDGEITIAKNTIRVVRTRNGPADGDRGAGDNDECGEEAVSGRLTCR